MRPIGAPWQRLRVIVADDDARVRGVLHEVLDDDDRFTVVALADSGELLALAGALRPDVVLMDVRMPGGGAAAARALLSLPPPLRRRRAPPRATPRPWWWRSPPTRAPRGGSMLRAGVVGYLAKGRLARAAGPAGAVRGRRGRAGRPERGGRAAPGPRLGPRGAAHGRRGRSQSYRPDGGARRDPPRRRPGPRAGGGGGGGGAGASPPAWWWSTDAARSPTPTGARWRSSAIAPTSWSARRSSWSCRTRAARVARGRAAPRRLDVPGRAAGRRWSSVTSSGWSPASSTSARPGPTPSGSSPSTAPT